MGARAGCVSACACIYLCVSFMPQMQIFNLMEWVLDISDYFTGIDILKVKENISWHGKYLFWLFSEVIEKSNWISYYSQHGDLHEVDKSLMLVTAFGNGSRRLADKNWEYKWGLKECLSRSRDTWSRGEPVPRSSASCVVWGLKLGTLSTTNCALVPFMNIHSGVFQTPPN